MEIKMSHVEFTTLFGSGCKNIKDMSIRINGVDCYIWSGTTEYSMFPDVTLEVRTQKPLRMKSEEEVAAEEAVKKAEESLKAAKATLDRIKEV